MRIHPLITRSDDLKALVDRLSKHPFIAVDTEFMRENTYWPDLCLIQVASSEEAAAIDPKADIDLKPLLDLFVAIFVMGIIIYRINQEFASLDTARLSSLKE